MPNDHHDGHEHRGICRHSLILRLRLFNDASVQFAAVCVESWPCRQALNGAPAAAGTSPVLPACRKGELCMAGGWGELCTVSSLWPSLLIRV